MLTLRGVFPTILTTIFSLVVVMMSFGQTDRVEPMQPNEPGSQEPLQPMQPSEPGAREPMQPIEPVDPVEPLDPAAPPPVDPIEPMEPVDPSDSDVLQPADPNDPAGQEPMDPAEPMEPADPGRENQDPDTANIAPEKLEEVAAVQAEIVVVQQRTQQEVDAIVEEAGIPYDEFLRMYYSLLGPDGEPEGNISEQVDEEFAPVIQEVVEREQQANEEVESIMSEHGMDESEYNQLSQEIAQDPELSVELNDMVSELIREYRANRD